MGVGPFSSPVSDEKQAEIKELIEAVLKTFTLQYTKTYAIELVKHIGEELKEQPEEWQLLERPKNSFKKPLKTGYLVKQGGVRKNWLRRFFVVRPDFKIEYYEDEETYSKGGKAKGMIAPCGYSVCDDLAKDLLARAQDIAEKMGFDSRDIPGVEKYPNYCWEIHHYRRRCYFIHAANQEEKDEWVKVFKMCCRHCYGFNSKDPVAVAAFRAAIRKTRWELGRWGYWTYGGTEEQVLSDLIVDELNYTVLRDIYYNIKGPTAVRMSIRNKVLQALDTVVLSAVTPAYKAMETAVKTLRGRVESVIRDKIEPLFKAKEEIKEKIKSAVLETVNPILSEKVSPRLAGIVQILASPMTEAFQETRNVFDEKITHLSRKVKDKNGFGENLESYFHDLDYAPRNYWVMRDAFKKVDVMEEPLWALRQFFDEIWPWSLIHEAHDTLRMILDMAMYTFEKQLEEEVRAQSSIKSNGAAAESAVQKVKDDVQQKFAADGSKATVTYYREIMMKIIMPFLLKIVTPLTKPIIDPINEIIPEPFREIVDIEEEFESVLEGIVGGAIDKVIEHVTVS